MSNSDDGNTDKSREQIAPIITAIFPVVLALSTVLLWKEAKDLREQSKDMRDLIKNATRAAEWYQAREATAKYLIAASLAVASLLVLSRDKLPQEPLTANWWLLRDALAASALSALCAFLVYIFSYRERFYWPDFDAKKDEWRKDRALKKLFVLIGKGRKPFEIGALWFGLIVGPAAFAVSLAAITWLLTVCFWEPHAAAHMPTQPP